VKRIYAQMAQKEKKKFRCFFDGKMFDGDNK